MRISDDYAVIYKEPFIWNEMVFFFLFGYTLYFDGTTFLFLKKQSDHCLEKRQQLQLKPDFELDLWDPVIMQIHLTKLQAMRLGPNTIGLKQSAFFEELQAATAWETVWLQQWQLLV